MGRSIIITISLVMTILLVSCGSTTDLRSGAGTSVSMAFDQRRSDAKVDGQGVVHAACRDRGISCS